jgi:hypothetical protein
MGFAAENPRPGAGFSRPASSSERLDTTGAQASAGKEDNYRALLDLVVQQTLLAERPEAQERLESLDELLDLARRRRGEAFSPDPVAIELIQTVLGTPFRALVADENEWLSMTRQVTQTLCDDPACYDRLSSLWRRLNERCLNGN